MNQRFICFLRRYALVGSLCLFFQQTVTSQTFAWMQPAPQTRPATALTPLREALHELRDYYHIDLIYADKLIEGQQAPTINFSRYASAETALQEVLKNLDLRFQKVKEKTYIIRRSKKAKSENPSQRVLIEKKSEEATSNERSVSSNPAETPQTKDDVQDLIVKGHIVAADTRENLVGVSVLLQGTTRGAITDADGQFQLSIPSLPATLIVSYVGYEKQEISVTTQTSLEIDLKANPESLNEVVVIGYGQVKKSDLTGSVASIKSAEINAYPTTNMIQALSGRAAGVYVSQNNGSPGSAISVRVRGTNSIQGSNEPLYVVDGFPYSGNPTLLNNSDIESIEVLKDASATAIYGSRGANGVVLITTRKGKNGRTNVSYEGYYGIQTIRKKLELMNAQEYANFYNEQATNDGLSPHFTQDQIDQLGKGTDWQDLVLRQAPVQSHSISVSGGNEKSRFTIQGGNFNQQGIIIGSNYVRNSLRTNLSFDLSKKFRLDVSSILSKIDSDRKNSEKGNRGSSLISAMLSGYPTAPAYNSDGSYTNLGQFYSWGSNAIVNPLNFIYQQSDKIRSNKVLANAALSYEPIKGLTLKTLGGIESTDDRTDGYTTNQFVNSTGAASISTARVTSLLSENTASYVKTWDKHSISAVAGFTYQDYTTTAFSASGSGFISNTQQTYDIGAAATQNVPSSSYSKWVLLSYLARVNYTFNTKILATVSFRSDGSSRYSEGQKWGSFPSVALAWRLSEEKFIQKFSFISDLKVRLGYGETGNTAINPYQTLNQLGSGQVVFGDALTTYYAPGTRLAGPLKWETTAQSDAGIDIGILNNRFTFTIDYYIKNTRDLLNTVPLPASLGYTTTIQNIGKIQNKGLELSASARVLQGAFKWDLSGNISFNRNRVMKLYEGSDILGEAINISVINDNINILREGESLGAFYGYVSKGYDENGMVVYEDFNNNGTRDVGDKKIIGNPMPKFTYGLNSSMSYKNFELTVFLQGSQGNDIFNLSAVNQTNDYGQALNMPREVYLNHWTPDHTNAKYPIIKTSSQPQVSDRFIEDGSYLRVKNIQLSYTLPVSKLNLKWLQNAQIYVSGQNLFTFTKYSWYDPEINAYGGSNSLQLGIDHYVYPVAKTTTVGLRVGF
ncbi:MAG: TonB-dependent receptor [Siphonobacter sp.]